MQALSDQPVQTVPSPSATDSLRLGLASGIPDTIRAAFEPVANAAAAEAYTRELTHSHYENFSVVSVLLPKHLRQDFCNVYAFCRIADDLGDEIPDRVRALDALHVFRQQLVGCYAGKNNTAVFTALRQTIDRHNIPMQPFDDLISAFVQDQTVNRYETFDQVVDYCTRSADPVGRLVLYMCGYSDEQRQRLSDKTCTALQLVNFWQDVRRDIIERDRIYLPAEDMKKFGVTEAIIRDGKITQNYRALLKFEVDRTDALFAEGRKLLPMLAPMYRRQIALFGKGGEAISAAIRRQNFDTLTKRPSLSKFQKARLVGTTLAGYLLTKLPGNSGGGTAR